MKKSSGDKSGSRHSTSGGHSLRTAKAVGKIIRNHREEKGLSRAGLAALSETTIYMVRRLESGTGKVSMLLCMQIAGSMHVDLSKIIRAAESEGKE